MLPMELEINKHRKDSGMFKGKMKRFSVYWKEKPYLLFSGHWNILPESFFPWYHILCFKLKAIIISVFHGTMLLHLFFFFLHPGRCLSCVEVHKPSLML